MFSKLKKKRAQAILTEYMVVIFIVVGVMTSMSVYIKRALQGRMYDARNYAVNSIKEQTKDKYKGPVYYAYEPYYANSTSIIESNESMKSKLFGGGASTREFDGDVVTTSQSETAPPKMAD